MFSLAGVFLLGELTTLIHAPFGVLAFIVFTPALCPGSSGATTAASPHAARAAQPHDPENSASPAHLFGPYALLSPRNGHRCRGPGFRGGLIRTSEASKAARGPRGPESRSRSRRRSRGRPCHRPRAASRTGRASTPVIFGRHAPQELFRRSGERITPVRSAGSGAVVARAGASTGAALMTPVSGPAGPVPTTPASAPPIAYCTSTTITEPHRPQRPHTHDPSQ
jgi:hypothetical protein